jgi:(p)ppGpp synthase/HD superfamily hydrolase
VSVSLYDPDRYVRALQLAAVRHAGQKMPSSQPGVEYPYLVHVTSVTAEVIAALPESGLDADLAVGCALLHDSIEDTAKTDEDKAALAAHIAELFGTGVRDGVLALSKRKTLPDGTALDKPAQMADSLRRIREQPHAVWAVKLADRITNLAPPPTQWSRDKCAGYQREAQTILETLGAASSVLATRLSARIADYPTTWGERA